MKMNWNKIIFFGIFLVVISLIVSLSTLLELTRKQTNGYLNSSSDISAQLEKQYPDNLVFVLQKYALPNNPSQAADLNRLSDDLLNLRVPASYQQLHWKIVKDVDLLKNQPSAKQKDQIRSEINELQQQYSWLSGVLAQFLLYLY